MEWLTDFIKKLVALDVFWGRRSKIHHGLNDGGVKADAIGDPTRALNLSGHSIFNVNNPDNECGGGHYHDLTILNENEALYIREATCLATDIVGQWVIIVSADTVNSVPDNTKSWVVGVISRKSDATTCDIITRGRAAVFTGLDPTSRRYFLDTDGTMTTTPPATGSVIELGKALNSTTLIVTLTVPLIRAT